MRKGFFILAILNGWLCWLPFSEAAVTLPNEPVVDHPADVVLPRDFPFPISEKVIETGGLKILVFGHSGTGDEIQMKVDRP